jgi:C4-type Zn-finger protein
MSCICPVCPSKFHLQVSLVDHSHKSVPNFDATNIMAAVTFVCGGVMLDVQYSETHR